MGAAAAPPAARAAAATCPPGRPVLARLPTGAPVRLAVAARPGARARRRAPPSELFLFDGRGAGAAPAWSRCPDGFERHDDELWDCVRAACSATRGRPPAARPRRARRARTAAWPPSPRTTPAASSAASGRSRRSSTACASQPLLAVVGPSGVGKSSFVQAGVVPGAARGWRALTVRPGPAPLAPGARLRADGLAAGDLAATLDAVAAPAPRGRGARRGTWCWSSTSSRSCSRSAATPASASASPQRWSAPARVGRRSGRASSSPCATTSSLRAEALPRRCASRLGHGAAAAHHAGAERAASASWSSRRAAPATSSTTPRCPREMVDAVAGKPGALALLSFTASELWELRDRQLPPARRARPTRRSAAWAARSPSTPRPCSHACRPTSSAWSREVFRHARHRRGHARRPVAAPSSIELLGADRTPRRCSRSWSRRACWCVRERARRRADRDRPRGAARAPGRGWSTGGARTPRARGCATSCAPPPASGRSASRPRGLLWRGDALAEYRLWRARYPGALTAVEAAFAAASLAEAGASGGSSAGWSPAPSRCSSRSRSAWSSSACGWPASASARWPARPRWPTTCRRQYENQGRHLVLAGEPRQALAYLAKAGSLGVRGAAHDFLVCSGGARDRGPAARGRPPRLNLPRPALARRLAAGDRGLRPAGNQSGTRPPGRGCWS